MLAHASDGALQPGRCRLRVQPCTVGCEPFARTHHRPCGMRFASLFGRCIWVHPVFRCSEPQTRLNGAKF